MIPTHSSIRFVCSIFLLHYLFLLFFSISHNLLSPPLFTPHQLHLSSNPTSSAFADNPPLFTQIHAYFLRFIFPICFWFFVFCIKALPAPPTHFHLISKFSPSLRTTLLIAPLFLARSLSLSAPPFRCSPYFAVWAFFKKVQLAETETKPAFHLIRPSQINYIPEKTMNVVTDVTFHPATVYSHFFSRWKEKF